MVDILYPLHKVPGLTLVLSLLIPGRAVGSGDVIRPSKSWVKEVRHCCPKPVPSEDTRELACLITLILGDHQARTAGGRALPGFRGLGQA